MRVFIICFNIRVQIKDFASQIQNQFLVTHFSLFKMTMHQRSIKSDDLVKKLSMIFRWKNIVWTSKRQTFWFTLSSFIDVFNLLPLPPRTAAIYTPSVWNITLTISREFGSKIYFNCSSSKLYNGLLPACSRPSLRLRYFQNKLRIVLSHMNP